MRPNLYLFPDDSATPSDVHKNLLQIHRRAARPHARALLKGGLRLALSSTQSSDSSDVAEVWVSLRSRRKLSRGASPGIKATTRLSPRSGR